MGVGGQRHPGRCGLEELKNGCYSFGLCHNMYTCLLVASFITVLFILTPACKLISLLECCHLFVLCCALSLAWDHTSQQTHTASVAKTLFAEVHTSQITHSLVTVVVMANRMWLTHSLTHMKGITYCRSKCLWGTDNQLVMLGMCEAILPLPCMPS